MALSLWPCNESDLHSLTIFWGGLICSESMRLPKRHCGAPPGAWRARGVRGIQAAAAQPRHHGTTRNSSMPQELCLEAPSRVRSGQARPKSTTMRATGSLCCLQASARAVSSSLSVASTLRVRVEYSKCHAQWQQGQPQTSRKTATRTMRTIAPR
jgi:hypothetical protein